MSESFGPEYIKKVIFEANEERAKTQLRREQVVKQELNHTINDFWKKARVHISNPSLYEDDFEYVLQHTKHVVHSLFTSYLETNKIPFHCILNHKFGCKQAVCVCYKKFIIDKSLWLNNVVHYETNNDEIDDDEIEEDN